MIKIGSDYGRRNIRVRLDKWLSLNFFCFDGKCADCRIRYGCWAAGNDEVIIVRCETLGYDEGTCKGSDQPVIGAKLGKYLKGV